MTYQPYKVNTVAADGLVQLGAKASAANILA